MYWILRHHSLKSLWRHFGFGGICPLIRVPFFWSKVFFLQTSAFSSKAAGTCTTCHSMRVASDFLPKRTKTLREHLISPPATRRYMRLLKECCCQVCRLRRTDSVRRETDRDAQLFSEILLLRTNGRDAEEEVRDTHGFPQKTRLHSSEIREPSSVQTAKRVQQLARKKRHTELDANSRRGERNCSCSVDHFFLTELSSLISLSEGLYSLCPFTRDFLHHTSWSGVSETAVSHQQCISNLVSIKLVIATLPSYGS